MVFNPQDHPVTKTLDIPLYYTGLQEKAKVSHEDGESQLYSLNRSYRVKIPVQVPAQGYTWFVIQ